MSDTIRSNFRKPFPEQLAAFRRRLADVVPTSAWDDLTRSQHDRAFMVAGAVQADLLADLANAVDSAVADGTTFEAFKADFRNIVQKHGWHGWTGDETEARRNWRMRIIYKTNMRTSYMAGRYAQLMNSGLEYWVYRHGGSAEPREHHLAWDGLILHRDHPFWLTHFPPNGWGCSCEVYGSRTERGAVRLGGNPNVKLPSNWQAPSPKTGAPAGIDKNWDYAPGASVVDDILQTARKMQDWPVELVEAYLEALPAQIAERIRKTLDELRG